MRNASVPLTKRGKKDRNDAWPVFNFFFAIKARLHILATFPVVKANRGGHACGDTLRILSPRTRYASLIRRGVEHTRGNTQNGSGRVNH